MYESTGTVFVTSLQAFHEFRYANLRVPGVSVLQIKSSSIQRHVLIETASRSP